MIKKCKKQLTFWTDTVFSLMTSQKNGWHLDLEKWCIICLHKWDVVTLLIN